MKTQLQRKFVRAGMLLVALASAAAAQTTASPAGGHAAPGSQQLTILYGAAYYNEYMPAALGPDRLQKDVALMQQAGITVVRLGESTWDLWEPAEGKFETAWMDRVVDAMGKAGIRVIMGTPTYSIPTWMYAAHPEVLARPMGGAYVGYGMRQNMNFDDPFYRRAAERLIIRMAEHYRDNPNVIGWQIDNETSSYGATNPQLHQAFVQRLKAKFGDPEKLNQAWFLNYWGQDVHRWEDLPTRDNATSTSYKLEWSRFQQDRVTSFLAWQAALVRRHCAPAQFVTTDYGGMMRQDVNEPAIARSLDVVADNVYHGTQDQMDGWVQAEQGDFSRSLRHANFLVTETNAQTLGWDSASQFPPYDGQLRLDVYTHISSGANMVEYWHWHSIHAGQETYWKGVLSHDLQPNRAYQEVMRTAQELKRVGPQLVNATVRNQVAILYSVDSSNALSFMPITQERDTGWDPTHPAGTYHQQVAQLHQALYALNVGADFVFPSTTDFSGYKLLIVPSLYIADDALLQRIADYVQHGGHVLMLYKSGFANENSAVRWELAPGPLRAAAGFTYQEFSNLVSPLRLKDDPFHAGTANQVSTWAEFLQPTTAKSLAFYDHPFFGRWPAITRNTQGTGSLTYEGTLLSNPLQTAVMRDTLADAGVAMPDADLPPRLHAKHEVDQTGHALHYFLNYSSEPVTFTYHHGAAQDVLTGHAFKTGDQLSVAPWDLIIAREEAATN